MAVKAAAVVASHPAPPARHNAQQAGPSTCSVEKNTAGSDYDGRWKKVERCCKYLGSKEFF